MIRNIGRETHIERELCSHFVDPTRHLSRRKRHKDAIAGQRPVRERHRRKRKQRASRPAVVAFDQDGTPLRRSFADTGRQRRNISAPRRREGRKRRTAITVVASDLLIAHALGHVVVDPRAHALNALAVFVQFAKQHNVAAPVRQDPGRKGASHPPGSLEAEIAGKLHLHGMDEAGIKPANAFAQPTRCRYRGLAKKAVTPAAVAVEAVDEPISTTVDVGGAYHPQARRQIARNIRERHVLQIRREWDVGFIRWKDQQGRVRPSHHPQPSSNVDARMHGHDKNAVTRSTRGTDGARLHGPPTDIVCPNSASTAAAIAAVSWPTTIRPPKFGWNSCKPNISAATVRLAARRAATEASSQGSVSAADR